MLRARHFTTAILPSRFERGNFTVWLREYDACAYANGWNTEAKIKKLPAFLRGEADVPWKSFWPL